MTTPRAKPDPDDPGAGSKPKGPARHRFVPREFVLRALVYFFASTALMVIAIVALIAMTMAKVEGIHIAAVLAAILGLAGIVVAHARAAFHVSSVLAGAEEDHKVLKRLQARLEGSQDELETLPPMSGEPKTPVEPPDLPESQ